MSEYKTKSSNDDTDDSAQKLLKKADAAFNLPERQNALNTWQKLAEFILPSQNANFFSNNESRGDRKDRNVYDITAPTACRDASAAFHSIVTNPASKWSKLRFKEVALNDVREANMWLSNATSEIHNALSDSNFDNQIGECYQSLMGLGTFVILHDEMHEDGTYDGMNFSAWHLGEIAYLENAQGSVDTIYRKFKLTAKKAFEMFGDNCPEEIKLSLNTKPSDESEYYHCIYPRDKKEVKLNNLGLAPPIKRPFASCYISCKGKKIVKEDGYYECPVYVGRWLKLPGEIYGFGPGHIARADVMTLNVLTRQILKGLAKAVDPVMLTTQNNILTGDMRPGRFVSVRNINEIKEAVTQSRFDIAWLEAKELKDAIKSAFYIDKLMLPPRTETGEMTAYEIQERLSQTQIVLGPPYSRLNYDFLTLCVMRTLKILMRAGIIPPVPQEVVQASNRPSKQDGTKVVDLDIAFVNSLARSQQMAELKNITSFMSDVAGMAQIKPEVLDLVDEDEIVEKMARIRDIPEELLRSSEAVQQMRDQKAQQQQVAMGLQAGEQASNIAKNVGGLIPQGGGEGIPNK